MRKKEEGRQPKKQNRNRSFRRKRRKSFWCGVWGNERFRNAASERFLHDQRLTARKMRREPENFDWERNCERLSTLKTENLLHSVGILFRTNMPPPLPKIFYYVLRRLRFFCRSIDKLSASYLGVGRKRFMALSPRLVQKVPGPV